MKTQNELLIELSRILWEYLPYSDAEELSIEIHTSKVKYLLYELEKRRVKPLSIIDKELVKDLFFNFC